MEVDNISKPILLQNAYKEKYINPKNPNNIATFKRAQDRPEKNE